MTGGENPQFVDRLDPPNIENTLRDALQMLKEIAPKKSVSRNDTWGVFLFWEHAAGPRGIHLNLTDK